MAGMQVGTKNLTSGSVTVSATMGIYWISIQAEPSSSGSIVGTLVVTGFGGGDTQILESGAGLTVGSDNSQSPLDGLTINWTSGTIRLLFGVMI